MQAGPGEPAPARRVPGPRGPRARRARRSRPGLDRRRDRHLHRRDRAAVTLASHVDHLVFAARTLDEGVSWCRETLGVVPAGGGEHTLMGTHNRVFRIDGPGFERAYFEIIAIDAAAAAPGRTRWFDLDDERMRSMLAQGPRLIHFVASTNDVDAAIAALAARGIDR